jgi:tetratricopeptide (TPR) repeat protein
MFGNAARLAAFLVFCIALPSAAQQPTKEKLDQLAGAHDWPAIVLLLAPLPARSADQDFTYASALAHLDRMPEAERAFQDGRRLAPRDPRFPTELAGIAFTQKRYPQAAHLLRQALRLAPHDAYANDFLGTVYFLEGNVPASLKYWNRVQKPHIADVQIEPALRISPALLDSAFAFAPAATLTLPQYFDSAARVHGLGIYPQPQFDLRALPDGNFSLDFRGAEKNGFGNTKLEALVQIFSELPFQGVTPAYFNARGQAINITSLLRWDAQKRRAFADFSGPFEHGAKHRYDFTLDLRNENWVLRNGFAGPAPVLASLNLRTERVAGTLASFSSDRFRWNAGGEFSHRDFRSVIPGGLLNSDLLASGYQLKQLAQVSGTILRIPEHRFTLGADASSEAARLWSSSPQSSEKLQGSLFSRWLPQSQGDDYATQQSLRAGKTFGQVPFDELFMLGLERDNDLPLRAHIGTRDGIKGSAPLGRNYLLGSWEIDKNLYGNGLVALKIGPFLDFGAINDPGTSLGSHKWLYDTGAQVKFRVFSTTLAFSYGKDLRSGNNAFYLTLLPPPEN